MIHCTTRFSKKNVYSFLVKYVFKISKYEQKMKNIFGFYISSLKKSKKVKHYCRPPRTGVICLTLKCPILLPFQYHRSYAILIFISKTC